MVLIDFWCIPKDLCFVDGNKMSQKLFAIKYKLIHTDYVDLTVVGVDKAGLGNAAKLSRKSGTTH